MEWSWRVVLHITAQSHSLTLVGHHKLIFMTRLRFSSLCPSLLLAERLQHAQQMWCKFTVSLCPLFTHKHTHRFAHPHWWLLTAMAVLTLDESIVLLNGFRRGPRAKTSLYRQSIYLHRPLYFWTQRGKIRTVPGQALGERFDHLKDRNWHNGLSTAGPRWKPWHQSGQGNL